MLCLELKELIEHERFWIWDFRKKQTLETQTLAFRGQPLGVSKLVCFMAKLREFNLQPNPLPARLSPVQLDSFIRSKIVGVRELDWLKFIQFWYFFLFRNYDISVGGFPLPVSIHFPSYDRCDNFGTLLSCLCAFEQSHKQFAPRFWPRQHLFIESTPSVDSMNNTREWRKIIPWIFLTYTQVLVHFFFVFISFAPNYYSLHKYF